MDNPYAPPVAELQAPADPPGKLRWYQQAWVALPLVVAAVLPMVVTLGAITFGLNVSFGLGAWEFNRSVFRKTNRPVARYLLTGVMTIGTLMAFFALRFTIIWIVRGF